MHKKRDGQPPVIPTPTNSRTHCCSTVGLLCTSCQCGKGARTRSGENHSKEIDPDTLKAKDLEPGQKVSVNQYISKAKGQLPHTKGKESASSIYSG
eukprot:2816070-Ditylum_brightwellii.AAC.1